DIWTIGEAALRAISVACGTRGACDPTRAVRGVREIARQMGRSASTISRELRRNAATRSGGLDYRATTAQWHADRAARRPKPVKLADNVGTARRSSRAAFSEFRDIVSLERGGDAGGVAGELGAVD